MSENTGDTLLSKNALSGVRLGISVSDSVDLPRLGLLESHFRLVLAEITRCVLVSGGELAYGGHLDPQGYTAFMIRELERYSGRNRPLRICLSWPEHRRLRLSQLDAERKKLGLYGEIVYLDRNGNAVPPDQDRAEEPPPSVNADTTAQSLTGLRRYMASHTQGRVFLGGKRAGFQGAMPGLIEEAILAVEQGQPIYLAAGLGGVTYDVACAIGVDNSEWFPPNDDATELDERLVRGLEQLAETAKATEWQSLDNGLSVEENNQLAACHRPSEIATLISLGLGRRFSTHDHTAR